MPQLRNLIAFFWVSVTLLAGLAWWYGSFSLKEIFIFLVFWLVAGVASVVLELAFMPTDTRAPKRLRIAGQVFRGSCAVIAVLLVVIAFVSVWRENFG